MVLFNLIITPILLIFQVISFIILLPFTAIFG